MSEVAEKEVGHAPAEGKITDEAIAQARGMIGLQLRPEGPYLQDATADTIRNFCNDIGDLNPLYRDAEHGRLSRHGSNVAHPMFPMAFGWIGRTRWGLPGVHGFYAGTLQGGIANAFGSRVKVTRCLLRDNEAVGGNYVGHDAPNVADAGSGHGGAIDAGEGTETVIRDSTVAFSKLPCSVTPYAWPNTSASTRPSTARTSSASQT